MGAHLSSEAETGTSGTVSGPEGQAQHQEGVLQKWTSRGRYQHVRQAVVSGHPLCRAHRRDLWEETRCIGDAMGLFLSPVTVRLCS